MRSILVTGPRVVAAWLAIGLVAGCAGGGDPALEPRAVMVGTVGATPLRVSGLEPEQFMSARDGALVVVGDYAVTIGGQVATLVSADAGGAVVILGAELLVGAYPMSVVAHGQRWDVPDALQVVPYDPSAPPDAPAAPDAPVATGDHFASTSNALYRTDPVAGTATLIGSLSCGSEVADLALSAAGELFAVADSTLYAVDPTTAGCTARAAITGVNGTLEALEFVPSAGGERLLGVTGTSPGKVYALDPATGVATSIGALSTGYVARGDLAWRTGDGLYATVAASGTMDWLGKIDPVTGSASTIAQTTPISIAGLTTVGTRLFGYTTVGAILELDPQNGAVISTRVTTQRWTGAAGRPPPL